jgi:hypothetical protein
LDEPRVTWRTLNLLLGVAEVRIMRLKQNAGNKYVDKVDIICESEVI